MKTRNYQLVENSRTHVECVQWNIRLLGNLRSVLIMNLLLVCMS